MIMSNLGGGETTVDNNFKAQKMVVTNENASNRNRQRPKLSS